MKKAFTLVEVLVVVLIVTVVMLSLWGIFRGSVETYLMLGASSSLNRQLQLFDIDINLALSGIIPQLPYGYIYLYLPPDRKKGLVLFVITSYSEKGTGISERSYWLIGKKLYVMEDCLVDGKVDRFTPEKAHLLVDDVNSLNLCLMEGKKRIEGGIYREYRAIPRYFSISLSAGVKEKEYKLDDIVEIVYGRKE